MYTHRYMSTRTRVIILLFPIWVPGYPGTRRNSWYPGTLISSVGAAKIETTRCAQSNRDFTPPCRYPHPGTTVPGYPGTRDLPRGIPRNSYPGTGLQFSGRVSAFVKIY
eukprot:1188540-Rhodomonas_salina.1